MSELSKTSAENIQIDPNVSAVELDDGSTVLLHLNTATYFSLNDTGARIWALLEEDTSLDVISSRLSNEYQISTADAEEHVRAFARQLEEEGLVTRAV